jgi:predicted DsbA family dithiol-disulfide isomerase
VLQRAEALKRRLDTYAKQERALEDARVLIDLAEEAGDDAVAREAEQAGEAVESALAEMEWQRHALGGE